MYFLVVLFGLAVALPSWRPAPLEENTELVLDVDSSQKRLQLIVTDPASPIFLYVTPCGARVHWQLFEPISGLSAAQEAAALRDPSLEDSDKYRLVAGESDNQRMTFFSHHVSQRAILVLSAPSTATVRVFFSPSLLRVEQQYPPLPHDTRIALSTPNALGESVLTWKISPSVRNAEDGRYHFCAIMASREPEWAACEHMDEGVESIKCVPQTNNSVVLRDLRPGHAYFITVFVRDNRRGSSSPYQILRAQIPGQTSKQRVKSEHRQKPLVLSNSVLRAAMIDARRGATLNYRFSVAAARNQTQALVIVHVCDGFVRMNVFRNGRLLKRTESFSGFRRLIVTNVRNGRLRFQIVNDDDRAKVVRVWASTQSSDSPYPNLPDDTSMTAVGRTCSTATLRWLRAKDPAVRYCIYERRESANFLEQLVSLAGNLCEGGIEASRLVGCYEHSDGADAEALIETTVANLKPSSTYRVDLLATPIGRRNAQPLPYRTVWVRTASQCS